MVFYKKEVLMLNSKLKQTLQIKLGTRTPSWQKIFDWIDGQRKKQVNWNSSVWYWHKERQTVYKNGFWV